MFPTKLSRLTVPVFLTELVITVLIFLTDLVPKDQKTTLTQVMKFHAAEFPQYKKKGGNALAKLKRPEYQKIWEKVIKLQLQPRVMTRIIPTLASYNFNFDNYSFKLKLQPRIDSTPNSFKLVTRVSTSYNFNLNKCSFNLV